MYVHRCDSTVKALSFASAKNTKSSISKCKYKVIFRICHWQIDTLNVKCLIIILENLLSSFVNRHNFSYFSACFNKKLYKKIIICWWTFLYFDFYFVKLKLKFQLILIFNKISIDLTSFIFIDFCTLFELCFLVFPIGRTS